MPRDMPMGGAPVCVVIGAGFGRLAAAARAGGWARMLRASAKLVDQPLQADYAMVLP